MEITKFCLEHNYFIFQDKLYLQTRGTAMGGRFTPCYANITMGLWEEFFLWNNNPFLRHIIYYGRYIDDVLLIWNGVKHLFMSFVAHCNGNDPGLCFTHVIDPDSLVFLDLELLHDADSFFTRSHIKPVGGNFHLHFDSCHHPACKNNIPKGQFLRLKRNCSNPQDYTIID